MPAKALGPSAANEPSASEQPPERARARNGPPFRACVLEMGYDIPEYREKWKVVEQVARARREFRSLTEFINRTHRVGAAIYRQLSGSLLDVPR